ncbi:hypothetical protein K3495_g12223 [Podosphaera aphanis]|nr:hypothetical protein K3495_g12223 [Podosphaera aphanis]
MNAKEAWDTLRNCWIDVYLGPLDMIVHDAGSNFTDQEFKQSTITTGIKTKAVSTEAYHSIGLVERYHAPLRRSYDVISIDLSKVKIHRNHILQMAVKTVNDTAGPDRLVPALLVFGAYPRMVESDPPASSVFERAADVKTEMKEIHKIHANKQVISALNMRNGPNTSQLKDLPLNSLVLEKTVFFPTNDKNNHAKVLTVEIQKPAEPRRSARLDRIRNLGSSFLCFDDHITVKSLNVASFLSTKEVADRELSIRLRTEGKISEPGNPFEASRKKEIEDLINQRVFHAILESSTTPGKRIFNARMVDTIKYNNFIPYEKSRLVIQAFNDTSKSNILTQSPTVQLSSQRLIISFAPGLILHKNFSLVLRDIKQAYVQASTTFTRRILAKPSKEIAHLFIPGAILLMQKPLNGIPESGNH